jgi:hypothetical protein
VFCPSGGAKRGAIFGALLREEILEEVGHAQWVFLGGSLAHLPAITRDAMEWRRESACARPLDHADGDAMIPSPVS